MIKPIGVLLALVGSMGAGNEKAHLSASFDGWEEMRVITCKGYFENMLAMDLDGNGRDALIGVNPSRSQLDVYRFDASWQPEVDLDKPNEIPDPLQMRHQAIPLDTPPVAVLAADIDGGQELLAILSAPLRVVRLSPAKEGGALEVKQEVMLKEGSLAGHPDALLQIGNRLLISMQEGIQQIPLHEGKLGESEWLSPRDNTGRLGWLPADLDGDGDMDLVEGVRMPQASLRWYQATEQGFLAPQPLRERPFADLSVVHDAETKTDLLAVLERYGDGPLRLWRLAEKESGPLGRASYVPLAGENARWCGVLRDEQPCLAMLDAEHPRLMIYPATEGGFGAAESYPVPPGISDVYAVQGEVPTLLMRAKKGGMLVSRWDGGRFTYPVALESDKSVAQTKMLGMGLAGHDTLWWAEVDGDDVLTCHSYVGGKHQVKTFSGKWDKAEKALWLGGEHWLMLDKYAKAPEHVTLGESVVREPMNNVDRKAFDQVKLVTGPDGNLRLARQTDGVVQWLDDQLQPIDQIMLPDKLNIKSYSPDASGKAWVLDSSGERAHRLAFGENGLAVTKQQCDIASAQELVYDSVLGYMAIHSGSLARLSTGAAVTLEEVVSFSADQLVAPAVEPGVHRLQKADITKAGREDLILFNDKLHQITVHDMSDLDADKLEPLVSWQVFDTDSYPYGSGGEYPRSSSRHNGSLLITALDFDGDGHRDLALRCYGQVLLYLAKNTPVKEGE